MKSTSLVLSFIVCLLGAVVLTGPPLFAQQEPASELVELVLELLADDDADVRGLALEQVRTEVAGEGATLRFAALLPKLKPEAEVGLLRALAERGDQAARSAVLQRLSDTDEPSVKTAAILAIGSLGTDADVAMLVDLLANGQDSEVSDAARRSLVRLQDEAVPEAMVAKMRTVAPELQATLIEILAERRAFSAIPAILDAAVDRQASVRGAAMAALGEIAGPEFVDQMLAGVLAAERGREREQAEKAVMLACGRIEQDEQREQILLTAFEKYSDSDKLTLLSTLGRVGGNGPLQVIEAGIASADPRQHDAAVAAICNWPNAKVADQLIRLSQTDTHPAHRLSALRALIRIAPLPDGRTEEEKLELLKKAVSLCQRDTERTLAIGRAAAIRIPETLRFVLPYVDAPTFSEVACLTIVELAHHRTLREPNAAEFDAALDLVIEKSKNATVIDRAKRYKKGETWVRPR